MWMQISKGSVDYLTKLTKLAFSVCILLISTLIFLGNNKFYFLFSVADHTKKVFHIITTLLTTISFSQFLHYFFPILSDIVAS
jgi:hypothetical protein